MNVIDASVFALLALADIAMLVRMRRSRRRRLVDQRMMRALRFALQREISVQAFAPQLKLWALRRAG
jgi:hypothetical protein